MPWYRYIVARTSRNVLLKPRCSMCGTMDCHPLYLRGVRVARAMRRCKPKHRMGQCCSPSDSSLQGLRPHGKLASLTHLPSCTAQYGSANRLDHCFANSCSDIHATLSVHGALLSTSTKSRRPILATQKWTVIRYRDFIGPSLSWETSSSTMTYGSSCRQPLP